MTANELDIKLAEMVRQLDLAPIMPHLTLVGSGQVAEVRDESGKANRYYQWLHCLMKLKKPELVVELGAAAGISTTIMALGMPLSSKLISVDCDPQAWRWMNHEYPQVTKILGDDLDLSIYPESLDLSQTDIWFIDSLHTEEQLRAEVKLYSPFWKKGAIVVFDDIRLPGLDKVWEELPYDKCENTIPNHYSGFGFCIV